MNTTQKIANQFLNHFVVLLLVYAAATLLGAVKFLGADPLALTLPYSQVAQFTSGIMLLALTSGVIGGGLLTLSGDPSQYNRLLHLTRRLWTLLCLLTIAAGVLGLLDSRTGLALPPLLALPFAVLLALVLFVVARVMPRWSGLSLVWVIGVIAIFTGTLIGLLPVDPVNDRIVGIIAVGVRDHFGIGLAAIALIGWQMSRFSVMSPEWIDNSIYALGGLWSFAAALITLQPLHVFGVSSATQIGVLALPVIMAIIAAVIYAALSKRNNTPTLSAHWISLSLGLLLIGAGLLGALNGFYDVNLAIAGTRLTDLQRTLLLMAFAAALLGLTAERRSSSRYRVPFALVSLGLIVSAIGLGAAGIVQVMLERILSVGYLETQTLIIPLYSLWIVGLVTAALGVLGCAINSASRRSDA